MEQTPSSHRAQECWKTTAAAEKRAGGANSQACRRSIGQNRLQGSFTVLKITEDFSMWVNEGYGYWYLSYWKLKQILKTFILNKLFIRLKITIMSPLHVNSFSCVWGEKCSSKQKNIFGEMRKCFYISANVFNVWLDGKQLDSHNSLYIQFIAIHCSGWSLWRKSTSHKCVVGNRRSILMALPDNYG